MMNLTLRSTLFLLLTTASAFTGPSTRLFSKYAKPSSSTSLSMAKNNNEILQSTIRAFGVAATVLALNTANVPAFAEELVGNPQGCEVIYSSSIQISETIKTMEFSLPSSYDSIADAKASAVDELSQDTNVITGTNVKKAPKKTKSADEGIGFGGPSRTPEEKAELAAQKRAEREAAAAEKVALEAEKQSERESLSAERQAEKESQAAERAIEKAKADAERGENQKAAKEAKEKTEAAKAAKAEQREQENNLKGADFVDMSLPSYGDASKGKAKSAFSL
jgi:flagellar biosynthesis GTPase FlhF